MNISRSLVWVLPCGS